MTRINSYRDIVPNYKYPIYISKYYIVFGREDASFGIFAGATNSNKYGCYFVKTGETSFYGKDHNIKCILNLKKAYIEGFKR